MREILFRGKTMQGEWVFGDYFKYYMFDMSRLEQKTDKTFHAINKLNADGKYVNEMIDVSTLGQYTGVKDENGNRIFEGDIVVYNDIKYEVSEMFGGYILQRLDNDTIDYTDFPLSIFPCGSDEMKFMGCRNDYCVSLYELLVNQQDFEGSLECQVVGNIHNKEETK